MPKLKKEHYFYIILLVVIAVGIFCFFLLKKDSQPSNTYQPSSPKLIMEGLEPGIVGEKGASVNELPPAMFNTTGTIKEVTDTGLIIQGSGSNFSDGEARDLFIVFLDSTLTTKLGEKTQYQGLEGLKYLKEGMEILVEGNENIKGKTQFQARYINIL